KQLSLKQCPLQYIPENTFAHLEALEALNITTPELSTQQKALPRSLFAALSSLKTLACGSRSLAAFDLNTLQNLNKLESLIVTCKKIKGLNHKLFTNLPHITKLTLITDTLEN